MRYSMCAVSIFLLIGCGVPAIQLKGDLPQVIRDDPRRVFLTAQFVENRTRLGRPIEAVIHFVPYWEIVKKAPELSLVQKHIEESRLGDDFICYSCIISAAGMSYPGTPHLQVDPRIWGYMWPLDQGPLLEEWRQSGPYILGHELLHRALDMQGVPVKDQHCRMKFDGHSAALAEFMRTMRWVPESIFQAVEKYEALISCPAQE